MDAGHHDRLRRLCPPQHVHKLRRAADFSARVPAGGVPDPYYGDADGFELTLPLIEALCEGVLGRGRAARRIVWCGSAPRIRMYAKKYNACIEGATG